MASPVLIQDGVSVLAACPRPGLSSLTKYSSTPQRSLPWEAIKSSFCREQGEQEHLAEQQAPLLAEDASHPPQADLSHLSPANPSRSASLEMTEGRRSYTNDLCDAAGETSGPRSGSVSCSWLLCLLQSAYAQQSQLFHASHKLYQKGVRAVQVKLH